MRLAILTDLHANLEATTACLAHARAQRATAFAFLGDVVGYGADPNPVVDLVAELSGADGLAVRGNHDAAAVAAGSETMDRSAARAVEWTAAQLGATQRAFLAGLPLVARRGPSLLVHASAEAPDAWTYVHDVLRASQSLAAAGDATYVFSGHVHVPALYYTGAAGRLLRFSPVPGVPVPVPARRRWLAVVGATGQPRDGDTAACYAIFDEAQRTLTYFRVPYDWRLAAAKIRAAGLPESLASRLEHGT